MNDRYLPSAEPVIAAGPRVLKVFQVTAGTLRALEDYKSRYPQGLTVLRIYVDANYQDGWDPANAARDFWQRLESELEKMTPAQRELVDFLEGPNEYDNYWWQDPRSAVWFSDFSLELAELVAEAGYRPLLGNIPVGNPPGTPEEMEATIEAYTPALRRLVALHGAWGYHSYTLRRAGPSFDVAEQYDLVFRYRRFYDYFDRQGYDELLSLPLILTEAGLDGGHGWRPYWSPCTYQQWLSWYDDQLQQDDYVLGAALFQTGDPYGWDVAETAEIHPWLASHLRKLSPAPSSPSACR
jgi:hypothetical protein